MESNGAHAITQPAAARIATCRRASELVAGIGRHVRNAVENPVQLLQASPLRALLEIVQARDRGQPFRGGGEELVDGDALPVGQLLDLPVHRIRQVNADGTHGTSPRIRRNRPDGIARTPNRSAPAKSLTLYVRMYWHPPAIAASRTSSSSGSGSCGRQR